MKDYDKIIKEILIPKCDFHASDSLRKNVQIAIYNRHKKKRVGLLLKLATVCAVAVIAFFAFVPIDISAKELLRESVAKLIDLNSIEMDVEIRTRSMENFKYINLTEDFVSHKITVNKNDSMFNWRVDKGGRIAIAKNGDSYSWIDSLQIGWHFVNTPPQELLGYISILLTPEKILEKELDVCINDAGSSYNICKEGKNLILDVNAEPNGNFENPYLINTSIVESKTLRRYVFDSTTKQLKNLSISVVNEGKEITVLRVSKIQYGMFNNDTFTLPDGIGFINVSNEYNPNGISSMTAVEAASLVLKAFASWDTSILYNAIDQALLKNMYKDNLSGAELISVGNSFSSGYDSNTFIPYVLKLSNGSFKRHNLVMRQTVNGNWIVVGGL